MLACRRVQESCLLENVLQPQRHRALLAVDVWCFLARFGSADLCRAHCALLSRLYVTSLADGFAGASDDSAACLHLQLLIARLVKFLAPEHQASAAARFKRVFRTL